MCACVRACVCWECPKPLAGAVGVEQCASNGRRETERGDDIAGVRGQLRHHEVVGLACASNQYRLEA